LGELGKLIFEVSSYKLDSNTKSYKMYKLSYKGILQIAARYDAKVRYKLIEIVDKTRKKQKALPQNYKEALLYLVAAEEEKEKLQIERDTAIKTKAQISRKREATVMGRLSQLTQKYNKLTYNEKRLDEYTAIEVAKIAGVYSKNGNPHSQAVSAFLTTLPNKSNYARIVKVELPTGQIVDNSYFNELFVDKFMAYSKDNNNLYVNGRNYKFSR
jgi:hypothetical protein